MTEQHEKYANELEKALAQFSENVNKIVTEMFSFEGKKEKDWKMKCPYKYGDEYFFIDEVGSLIESRWDGLDMDKDRFSQGNIFPTKQATELEAKRRNLLTRFRAFRDECNGDWKPDWTDMNESKWSAVLSVGKLKALSVYVNNIFDMFGHFKNQEDCKRAIEIFGEEIIELFVEA